MNLRTTCVAVTVLGCLLAPQLPAQDKPASAARLPFYPLDLAVRGDGATFVVDRNLHGVWEWKANSLSVFFEGSAQFRTPLNAARCLAFDQDGVLLVGDSATRDIYRLTSDGKAEPITNGKIGIPMDIAVKPNGTIYVADLETRSLLRIPTGTSAVEEVAKVNPRGVFIDSQERVWVVSQNAEQLQIVSDDGKTEAIVNHRVFEFPHQVVVNDSGEAFVTDGYRKAIWKVISGSEPEILFEGAPLQNPVGIALVDNELIVVDPSARKSFKLNNENVPVEWFEIRR